MRDGDVIGVERALDREQPRAVLVLLADADRLIGRAIELLAQLRLDQRTLFLDDDDEIEPTREIAQALAARAARDRRSCRAAARDRWP